MACEKCRKYKKDVKKITILRVVCALKLSSRTEDCSLVSLSFFRISPPLSSLLFLLDCPSSPIDSSNERSRLFFSKSTLGVELAKPIPRASLVLQTSSSPMIKTAQRKISRGNWAVKIMDLEKEGLYVVENFIGVMELIGCYIKVILNK